MNDKTEQRKLLLTLKIKKVKKKIDDAVEWNFGYCPDDKNFDRLMEQLNDMETELKQLNGEG